MSTRNFQARSSFVESISYNEERQILTIVARGQEYSYADVPPQVVEALVDAPSQGSYYTRFIKGKYERI